MLYLLLYPLDSPFHGMNAQSKYSLISTRNFGIKLLLTLLTYHNNFVHFNTGGMIVSKHETLNFFLMRFEYLRMKILEVHLSLYLVTNSSNFVVVHNIRTQRI